MPEAQRKPQAAEIHTRLLDTPSSIDAEARTVTAIAATETPVRRRNLFGEEYEEILRVSPAAVDTSRLAGAPVLDTHANHSVQGVLGSVPSFRFAGPTLETVLRFDETAEAEEAFAQVQRGTVRQVSVGYEVLASEAAQAADGTPQQIVTRWRPLEVSVVPIAADPAARIRSADFSPQLEEADVPETNPTNDGGAAEARNIPNTAMTRAAVKRERQRVAEIRALAEGSGIEADELEAIIERGSTPAEASAHILEHMKQAQAAFAPTGRRGLGDHPPEGVGDGLSGEDAAIAAALYARAFPGAPVPPEAKRYLGISLDGVADIVIARGRGGRAGYLNREAKFKAALKVRSYHTTSDFSAILGDVAQKSLQAGYEAAASGLRPAAAPMLISDFKPHRRVKIGDFPPLQPRTEGGELKHGTVAEGQEIIQLETQGVILAVTRELLINDDLGAFTRMPMEAGASAAEWEAQTMTDVLTANAGAGPNLEDGTPVFDASRGNVAETPGAISVESVGAGRAAMRLQTGLAGRLVGVGPRYLLVPAALETAGQQLIADLLAPTQVSEVNPFGGNLELLVEPRLDAVSATAWYLVADPARIETFVRGTLDGRGAPVIEDEESFDHLGMRWRVYHDFAAAFLDFRGWYRNAGA